VVGVVVDQAQAHAMTLTQLRLGAVVATIWLEPPAWHITCSRMPMHSLIFT
jgi:hypothetical protein